LLTEFSDVGFWVFFIGGDGLVIPLLAARLTGRKTILVLAGSGSLTQRAYGDPLEGLTRATSVLACALSNRIALYSLRLKSEWRLERYSSKIVIANHHFPDYDMFRIRRLFVDRCNTIGYVGRLSKEKGVMNLIRAVPHLMSSKPGIGLTIAGDGPCRRAVLDFLNEQGLEKKVKVLGWISHDQLPELLNELKLVVIPSWTEGLPNVMLEAMACGTPVLAMPVGAIPDVIMDGETGFILEDNSPACIAKSISFVLESSKLEGVSEKAHSVVMRDFQYKKAVSTWESIIDGINKE
jgi:glycosyltransferase involved in cell wall biosynthesis